MAFRFIAFSIFLRPTYNGLGQLICEDEGGSLVQYVYSYMTNAAGDYANNSRLIAMIYPDGRAINYLYGGMSTIQSISYDSDTNVATVTTDQADGLGVGSPIDIQGASVSAFDSVNIDGGEFTVSAVLSPTEFQFVPKSTPSSDSDSYTIDSDMTVIGGELTLGNLETDATPPTTSAWASPSTWQEVNLPSGTNFSITVNGASPSAYDGSFTATMESSSGPFTYTTGSSVDGDATGSDIVVGFDPGASLDDVISRVSGIQDAYDGSVLAGYQYLGLSTMVQETRSENAADLTYIYQPGDTLASADGGDQYTGLDRFGRVIDQNWTYTRLQYGYDADGDVLYVSNLPTSGGGDGDASMSELYTYDDLHRVTSWQVGALTDDDTAISGTPGQSESWTYDALGNIASETVNGTEQTRTANSQNQITDDTAGDTPSYDSDGDMLSDDQGYHYVYDAWNRIVKVLDSSDTDTLETYSCNASGQRITETQSGAAETDLYLNPSGNVIEERQDGSMTAQNVWGEGYVTISRVFGGRGACMRSPDFPRHFGGQFGAHFRVNLRRFHVLVTQQRLRSLKPELLPRESASRVPRLARMPAVFLPPFPQLHRISHFGGWRECQIAAALDRPAV